MTCILDSDVRHLDVDQAFVPSDFDTEKETRWPPGCGQLDGKVVRVNKAHNRLKQSCRSWYKVLSSTLAESGFEVRFVDPCAFRLMADYDIVAAGSPRE